MARRTNVRAPPTILIIKSTMPTLISLPSESRGRKSAKLLSKAFSECALFQI
jgi:hypothetical protein